jgi:hypothetical protein
MSPIDLIVTISCYYSASSLLLFWKYDFQSVLQGTPITLAWLSVLTGGIEANGDSNEGGEQDGFDSRTQVSIDRNAQNS